VCGGRVRTAAGQSINADNSVCDAGIEAPVREDLVFWLRLGMQWSQASALRGRVISFWIASAESIRAKPGNEFKATISIAIGHLFIS
jgi:hypothetical protein